MAASEGVECLVRYGLSGRVAWFAGEDGPDAPSRGDAVVVRTVRGLELGEMLVVEAPRGRAGEDSVGPFRVLRRAGDDDLTRAREADALRESRFDLCRGIVEHEGWPLELVDVEPLLDFSTVLIVLPLDELDPAPIRARFRVSCDFDVHVEPVGDEPVVAEPTASASSGRCGDCDCGSGGCSKAAAKTRADGPATASGSGSCATKPHGAGCSSCGVAAWKSAARRQDPPA
ncbi:PSP1 C-terminal domain-containing protein [Paludisphaera rhizosphaerae]|uniref:PSP1 C-terminal domain-containing protein n=1 Tax=Paludisphaera rhizosphaerae TaxID=2711216 RepID=UPI0013EBD9FA|nr:PSP1 C-terminal domain-containing protein [Paludisphaera rhizosphaerae]